MQSIQCDIQGFRPGLSEDTKESGFSKGEDTTVCRHVHEAVKEMLVDLRRRKFISTTQNVIVCDGEIVLDTSVAVDVLERKGRSLS